MYIRYQDRLEMMEKAAFFKALGKGVADIAHMVRPVGRNMMYHLKGIGKDLIHGNNNFYTRGQALKYNLGQMKNSLKAYGKSLSSEGKNVLKGTAITAGGLAGGYGGKQLIDLLGNNAKQTREAAIAENPELKGLLESPLAKSPLEFYADK